MRAFAAMCVCFVVVFSALGEDDTREHVYHEGDIELAGNERMTIENVIYHQSGNIWIRDNAELTIRNAHLVFEDVAENRWGPAIWGGVLCVTAFDESTIHMENVVISAGDFRGEPASVRVDAGGQSQVTLDGVTMENSPAYGLDSGTLIIRNSRISSLNVFHNATVEVHSSWILGMIALVFGEDTKAVLTDLRSGLIEEWQFPRDHDAENPAFSLLVRDTTSGSGWSVRVDDSADITIRDSQLDRSILGLRNPQGTLGNIARGYFRDWSSAGKGLESSAIYRLINTEVSGHWNLFVYDGWWNLTIKDCEFADVSFVNFTGQARFENVAITGFQISNCTSSFEFVNCALDRGFDFWDTWLEMSGSLEVSSDAIFSIWERTNVRRSYDLLVLDADGDSIGGCSVRVGSGTSHAQNLTTNDAGKASFTLQFGGYNARDLLSIEVSTPGGDTVSVEVGFLSSSPVVIRVDQ